MLRICVVVVLLAAGSWFASQWYAEQRVRSAFQEMGMAREPARCMGRQLVRRLSFAQLRKLEALGDAGRDVDELVAAARALDDPRIARVTTRSAVLCLTGLAS